MRFSSNESLKDLTFKFKKDLDKKLKNVDNNIAEEYVIGFLEKLLYLKSLIKNQDIPLSQMILLEVIIFLLNSVSILVLSFQIIRPMDIIVSAGLLI